MAKKLVRTRTTVSATPETKKLSYENAGNAFANLKKVAISNPHKKYSIRAPEWLKVRDCMDGEAAIKAKSEMYLPRPEGMSKEYSKSYDSYKERAHFPLIVPYALSGALGVIITKLPDFNLPPQLDYLKKEATKDGRSLQQLFIDILIENFQTGRVPIALDVIEELNEFRFVQYAAEDLINWKRSIGTTVKSIAVAVLKEEVASTPANMFQTTQSEMYKVMHLEEYTNEIGEEKNVFKVSIFGENGSDDFSREVVPLFMGKPLDEVPLFMSGSINNSFDVQPIPLIAVANCSVQIYRKEADLANSEFLSCNPTLVVTGAVADGNMPNVVGSSVMIVIPNELARVSYTRTDTAALTHVKEHIKDLYEEAIRHGVSILDSRKGVEAAEALRIRQATQSASLYSLYLSVLTSMVQGLKMMCKWGGYDPELVVADAPTSLTFGIPDSNLLKEIIAGFAETGVIPISIVHKYLVSSGLLEQTVSYEEYLSMVEENVALKEKLGIDKTKNVVDNGKNSSIPSSVTTDFGNIGDDGTGTPKPASVSKTPETSKIVGNTESNN